MNLSALGEKQATCTILVAVLVEINSDSTIAPGAGFNFMTPEQQRSAIAEACGWNMPAQPDWSLGLWPDYLHDLNAMHEAEKVLEEKGVATVLYMDTLHKLVGYHSYDVAHATAAQRSEAFLRTIGKWVEE